MSRIFKVLSKINNNKETPETCQKRGKEMNRHFSEEDRQVACRYMEKCSFIIMELENKRLMSYYITAGGAYKNSEKNLCCPVCDEKEFSSTCGGYSV